MRIGDVVKHKGTGLQMTVIRLIGDGHDEEGSGNFFKSMDRRFEMQGFSFGDPTCVWFEGTLMQQAVFKTKELEIINLGKPVQPPALETVIPAVTAEDLDFEFDLDDLDLNIDDLDLDLGDLDLNIDEDALDLSGLDFDLDENELNLEDIDLDEVDDLDLDLELGLNEDDLNLDDFDLDLNGLDDLDFDFGEADELKIEANDLELDLDF